MVMQVEMLAKHYGPSILRGAKRIGYALRLVGGALFLLFTIGPVIVAPFFWLYMMFSEPWLLLNPFFWIVTVFSAAIAAIAVFALMGRA